MTASTHLTNGDIAADQLRELVAPAAVIPWRDMLHEGPVPARLDAGRLAGVRARYLAEVGGLHAETVERSLLERDLALTEALDGERLTLWFEHDLYDQLQLLQVLDRVAEARDRRCRVMLVQAAVFLTSLTAEGLRALGQRAAPVSEEQLALASQAWAVFREPTPAPLRSLLDRDLRPLPFLESAMLRLLEELPAVESGLGRTERQILELLEAGPSTPERLFVDCSGREAAAFLGDQPFFQRLERLAGSPPLLDGLAGRRFAPQAERERNAPFLEARIHITAIGRAVLSGEQDFCALRPVDHWWGGTRLGPDNLWRWDAEARRLL